MNVIAGNVYVGGHEVLKVRYGEELVVNDPLPDETVDSRPPNAVRVVPARPRSILLQAVAGLAGHVRDIDDQLREDAEERVGAELEVAAHAQAAQQDDRQRGQQHLGHPDGLHPGADQLPPGGLPQAQQGPLRRLPQDAELRRPHPDRRARQDAQHASALQSQGESARFSVSVFD